MSDTQATDGVLEAILQYNQPRKPKLVRLKLRRMLKDPFTFFRGTIHFFAATGLSYAHRTLGRTS